MTDIKKTIQTELNRIQKDLKAPKNQKNKFGNYDYRSAEDILEAYKKVAEDTTLVLGDKIVTHGEGEHTRFYVEATATLTCGQNMAQATAFAREPMSKKGMDEAQITGATSSYARKYALNALFAIDDAKDADFTKEDQKNVEILEKHEAEIAMIDNEEDLKDYWNKNKGAGKAFAHLVTKRKNAIKNEKAKNEKA